MVVHGGIQMDAECDNENTIIKYKIKFMIVGFLDLLYSTAQILQYPLMVKLCIVIRIIM